jgi:hypothetical protein
MAGIPSGKPLSPPTTDNARVSHHPRITARSLPSPDEEALCFVQRNASVLRAFVQTDNSFIMYFFGHYGAY